MNNSNCNRYLLVFAMLLSIITPSFALSNAPTDSNSAMPSREELQAVYQEYQEQLEPYFTRALAQVQLLDCMLQDLAFNLANNASLTTKDRGQVINKIRTMRELMSNLKDTQRVIVTPQLVNSFIFITRTAILQLTTGLKHGIDKLESIDLNTLKIPASSDIGLEELVGKLAKELAHNDTLIKNLEKLSDSMGLHWYNKVYRNFKRLVVEPAKAAAPKAFVGASLGAAAFFAWYYFGGENPKWLREKIGWPQESDIGVDQYELQKHDVELTKNYKNMALEILKSNHIDSDITQKMSNAFDADTVLEPKKIGLFGQIENKLFRLKNGRYALGGGAMLFGKEIMGILFPRMGQSIANKIKAADNFLMGGTYKNRSVDNISDRSEITFDSIIGQEDAKKYGRILCQYLKNPEFFDRTGVAPATGILLFGDTRTGKSFYISALQGEIQKALGKDSFKVWKVSFEDVLKAGIHTIMEAARSNAPMIVVIEEIDLLKLQRTGDTKLLAEFMTAMSSCLQDNRPDKTVIIIGTTNKLENLEPALRQDGRFGKHIYFDYPKFSERKEFIEHELVKTACNLNQFDIDKLARDTEGCSFEKLRLFIKRTFMRAKLYGETVSQKTLEQSIDENIRGISVGEVTLDHEQKQLIAAHLAGHTVASILLDPHQKISKVTLHDVANKIQEELVGIELWRKDEKQAAVEHGKIFANHDHDMPGIESKDEKLKQCKIWLAGHVAETILLGSCGYGYHATDKQVALNIAKSMTYGAIDLASLPKKMRDQYYDDAFALLNTCEQEVTKLLEEHRTELAAVMNALVEKLTLNSYELRKLVLGEQSVIEQLDANNILADLLKDQPGIELDETVEPTQCSSAQDAAKA